MCLLLHIGTDKLKEKFGLQKFLFAKFPGRLRVFAVFQSLANSEPQTFEQMYIEGHEK